MLVSNKSIAINPNVDPGSSGTANIVSLPDMPVMDHAPWIYP